MLRRLLAYPLHTEVVTTGLFFYVVMSVLFIGASLSWRVGSEALWMVLTASGTLFHTSLLFEYGLDLLDATAANKPRPPALRASLLGGEGKHGKPNLGSLFTGERRFLRQVFVLFLLGGTGLKLYSTGYEVLAFAVWTLQLLTMPAMMAANVLFRRLPSMLDPRALIDCIRCSGLYYLSALVLLTATVLLTWICFSGSIVRFLSLAPVLLYIGFLYFHVVGLGIDYRYDELFPPVDFHADRKQLEVVSDNLATLNKSLTNLHEELRAGKLLLVHEQLALLMQRSHWNNFEQVFRYVSEWFDARPAIQLSSHYLEQAGSMRNLVRALALSDWCLARDAAFTFSHVGNLRALAADAMTVAQFRTTFTLIENHLQRHPDSPHRERLQQLLLMLAGEKLKDETLFRRVQQRIGTTHFTQH